MADYYPKMRRNFWSVMKQNQGFGLTGTGPHPTDDLTSVTRNSVFLAQLQRPDPTALDPESLYTAKIVETHQYANDVFHSLKKHGVIDGAGHPDTTKIDRTLVSKIAIISVPKCRELVNMLFWWEEELTRWRLLDQEATEIKQAGSHDDERLAVIEAKKRVMPSSRRADGSIKDESAAPPTYTNESVRMP